MIDYWTVENYFYLKNRLTYGNQKSRIIYFFDFLKEAKKLVLLCLENYIQ